MSRRLLFGIIFAVALVALPIGRSSAQEQPVFHDDRSTVEEKFEAVVLRVLEERLTEEGGVEYQRLELLVAKGSAEGQTITVENGTIELADLPRYKEDDRVEVLASTAPDGTVNYYVTDYVRRGSLFWMLMIFLAVAVLVGGRQGAMSVLGMVYSFVVIFVLTLPALMKGYSPLGVALISSAIIVPPTFYLSHGLNRKTHVAIAGTVVSLAITGFVVVGYISWAKMTGHGSEDLSMLQALSLGAFDARGLLLAGIMISLLGVFDDVTVAQAAVVQELRIADQSLNAWELYARAMRVGKDHIASMVNTLILVYAGAALPMLMLIKGVGSDYGHVLNHEAVAEEIIQALVGSTGLILAVPITTVVASMAFRAWRPEVPVRGGAAKGNPFDGGSRTGRK